MTYTPEFLSIDSHFRTTTDHDALLTIQELMSGVAWTPDTLQEIAQVMEAAGYTIEESD